MTDRIIWGRVVHGDQRGRELGFPTANVEVTQGVIPEDGVYQGWLTDQDGSRHAAAISVGRRTTYYGAAGARLVEAYVLDFDRDLYDHWVTVELGEQVRPQASFSTSEDLIAQMHKDVANVRRLSETTR